MPRRCYAQERCERNDRPGYVEVGRNRFGEPKQGDLRIEVTVLQPELVCREKQQTAEHCAGKTQQLRSSFRVLRRKVV